MSLLCCYCFFNAKNLRVGRTTLNREKKRMARDVFTGTWYSLIFTCVISGYRLHKFELFLVGFLIAFSFSYIMCTEHLSDELSGTVLEYKDQVKNLKILMIFYTWGQFQNRPCVPPPTPFRRTPRHLTFFKNFNQIPWYVGSLDGPMPHQLVLQEVSNPPSSSDYSTNFLACAAGVIVWLKFWPRSRKRSGDEVFLSASPLIAWVSGVSGEKEKDGSEKGRKEGRKEGRPDTQATPLMAKLTRLVQRLRRQISLD